MPSASEQWLFNITMIRSTRFRDVLPVDRRMSFLPNVESPQEWSLLRIMWSFLPSCLCRFKKAESSGLRTWLCQRCLFPEHATLSSPQPSTAPSLNQHLSDERELPMDSPNCVDNADNVLKRISQLRRFYCIPIRIPVADALAESLLPKLLPKRLTGRSPLLRIRTGTILFPFISSLWAYRSAQTTQVHLSHPSSVQI